MQFFGRRVPDAPSIYREVLFDQTLSFLKPVPGEEVILEMVRCPGHLRFLASDTGRPAARDFNPCRPGVISSERRHLTFYGMYVSGLRCQQLSLAR